MSIWPNPVLFHRLRFEPSREQIEYERFTWYFYFFNWSISRRTGPYRQKHNLCESRVKMFKRFCNKIFNAKFSCSRQTKELVLTSGCMNINSIPIDGNLRTTISLDDLMYPKLRNDNCTISNFELTSLQSIFNNCKQVSELIKNTYNDILLANFHKYSVHSFPKLEMYNIVMFKKDSNYFYGVVSGIQGGQTEILCSGVSYTRPAIELIHIANSSAQQ